MIHLSRQLVLADLRAAPERAVATAVLLGAASLLPALLSIPSTTATVLALCVAMAATAGAVALHERRHAILDRNGGGRGADVLLAAAGMLPPAVLAVGGAWLAGRLLDPRPDLSTIVTISAVVPLLVAAAASAFGVGDRDDAPRPARPWWWRAIRGLVAAVVVLGTGVLSPALPFAVAAFLLLRASRRSARSRPVLRWIGVLVAVLVVLYSAWAAGRSSSWSELSFILLLLGPGVAVSVAVLGVVWTDAVARGAGGLAPRTRVALSPLRTRRSSLGPTYGLLAVVAAWATMQATVGASFGQREDDRERTLPTITTTAGSLDAQAIVVVPPVDVAELQAVVEEVTASRQVRGVVIRQVGVGSDSGVGLLGDILEGEGSVRLAEGDDPVLSTWLGVVAPADLPLLGWDASPDDLAAGAVVVTPAGPTVEAGEVEILTPAGTVARPAAVAGGRPGGAELPGGLVSPEAAAALSSALLTSRVVVVPEPGATVGPDDLRTIAAEIRDRTADLPPADAPGLAGQEAELWRMAQVLRSGAGSAASTVLLGSDEVVVFESGPLNDVPVLAGTREAGRDQLIGLIGVALLMSVAVVVLAVGATAREDEVYRVQGAPDGLRAAIAAVQAAVLAGSTAAFAVVVGVGVPALAFRTYNGHADLPEIPLVVPREVALILALPVLAAGLSAGLVAWRSRGRASSPRPVDELLW